VLVFNFSSAVATAMPQAPAPTSDVTNAFGMANVADAVKQQSELQVARQQEIERQSIEASRRRVAEANQARQQAEREAADAQRRAVAAAEQAAAAEAATARLREPSAMTVSPTEPADQLRWPRIPVNAEQRNAAAAWLHDLSTTTIVTYAIIFLMGLSLLYTLHKMRSLQRGLSGKPQRVEIDRGIDPWTDRHSQYRMPPESPTVAPITQPSHQSNPLKDAIKKSLKEEILRRPRKGRTEEFEI
jgi:hypothetical protein